MNTEILDRVPPHSAEAEAGVLGSIILSADVYDDVAPVLTTDDFYDPAHRLLYRHMAEMREAGLKLDLMLLVEHLRAAGDLERVGGTAYLAQVFQSVPNYAHAVHYARIVRDHARRRQLIDLAAELLNEAYAGSQDIGATLADAETRISDLADHSPVESTLCDGPALADVAIESLQRRKAGTNEVFRTGVVDLDAMLGGGFEPGELIVLGARTSFGKTAFATNILAHATIVQTHPAALFSLEMTRREIVERIITSHAWLNSLEVSSGTLSAKDEQAYLETAERIRRAPIWVDDSPMHSIGTFTSAARRLKRKHDVRLIVLDYIQLIEPAAKGHSRERELAAISRRLKALAKELHIPIFVLAQLNKEGDGVRPNVKHIRECEAIGHEANRLLMLHRPSEGARLPPGQGEEVEIIVAKNRSGPKGEVPLLWFRDSMRFESPAPARIKVFDEFNADGKSAAGGDF